MAKNTKDAYRADWVLFQHWCQQNDRPSLPASPDAVADFLAAQADLYRPATLTRRLAAINKMHAAAGAPTPGADPLVRAVMAGIRRTSGTKPRRMAPMLTDDLRRVLGHLDRVHYPAGVAARRDACLLLFGFAGAFRRSELVALDLRDIRFVPADGLHITIARAKNDQEGAGTVKALPYGRTPETCPVCAWVRWVTMLLTGNDRAAILSLVLHPEEGHVCRAGVSVASDIADQPLFPPITRHGLIRVGTRLSGQAVNEIVRRRLVSAGMSPDGWGSHSLRAGFVTQALRAGATDHQVMRQTGHRSAASVTTYDRENNPMKGNAVLKVGL